MFLKGGRRMNAQSLEARFADDCEQALNEAVALYGQPLLRYCHHILCDYHDAQDAVQTTFIKAYDNRSRFRAARYQPERMAVPDRLYHLRGHTAAAQAAVDVPATRSRRS